MQSLKALALTIAAGSALAAAAGADPLPAPTHEYSADLKLVADANGTPQHVEGRLYWANDRERFDLVTMGHTRTTIRRRDEGVTWVLVPLQQVYVEAPEGGPPGHGPRLGFDLSDHLRSGEATLKTVGRELANGIETTKYAAKLTSADGTALGGHIWLTDDHIAVRVDLAWARGDDAGRFHRELRNLKRGKQDPALFEIPSGYTKFAPPTTPVKIDGGPLGPGLGRDLIEQMQDEAIADSDR